MVRSLMVVSFWVMTKYGSFNDDDDDDDDDDDGKQLTSKK